MKLFSLCKFGNSRDRGKKQNPKKIANSQSVPCSYSLLEHNVMWWKKQIIILLLWNLQWNIGLFCRFLHCFKRFFFLKKCLFEAGKNKRRNDNVHFSRGLFVRLIWLRNKISEHWTRNFKRNNQKLKAEKLLKTSFVTCILILD